MLHLPARFLGRRADSAATVRRLTALLSHGVHQAVGTYQKLLPALQQDIHEGRA